MRLQSRDNNYGQLKENSMNRRAMRGMGIKSPIALVKKEPQKRHNNNEQGRSEPAHVHEQKQENRTMPEIAIASQTETATATPAPVAAPPPASTAAKVDLPALDPHNKYEVMMAELGVRQQEAEARNAEAAALRARISEDGRQFDKNHGIVEKKVGWAEEDRTFVNRHLIPAVKFVLGVGVVFGTAALIGALTGEDATEAVGELAS